MRVTLSSDYRYHRTPDGTIWTDGPCHYQHFTRYLAVFDAVNVVARVQEVPQPAPRMQASTGHQVSFSPLPYYQGAWQFLTKRWQISGAAAAAIHPQDAIVLSAPAVLAGMMRRCLVSGRPYGLQVLGDPYEVFAPGVTSHPLRPALRWWATSQLQRLARQARSVLYVTEQSLQRRYPAGGAAFAVSDVDLGEDAFRSPTTSLAESKDELTLIGVGTMSQLYKGYDVLLEALAILRQRSTKLKLVLVGDGRYRPQLEAQARRLHLDVTFLGQLPAGAAIRQELDRADIFLMPSRTEGLPRALVEAMARGLPCIASRVGGIPELLPDEALAPPGDAAALASIIARACQEPAWRRQMAERNFARAQDFHAEALKLRRESFYRLVREQTHDWLKTSVSSRGPAAAVEALS